MTAPTQPPDNIDKSVLMPRVWHGHRVVAYRVQFNGRWITIHPQDVQIVVASTDGGTDATS